MLARGDGFATDWHDHPMVLTPAASVHRLPATPSTVHWGYFDPRLEPVLTVAPGDLVATVTQGVDHRQGVHGRIDKRCFPRWNEIPA